MLDHSLRYHAKLHACVAHVQTAAGCPHVTQYNSQLYSIAASCPGAPIGQVNAGVGVQSTDSVAVHPANQHQSVSRHSCRVRTAQSEVRIRNATIKRRLGKRDTRLSDAGCIMQ
jgi:hypothetical protein